MSPGRLRRPSPCERGGNGPWAHGHRCLGSCLVGGGKKGDKGPGVSRTSLLSLTLLPSAEGCPAPSPGDWWGNRGRAAPTAPSRAAVASLGDPAPTGDRGQRLATPVVVTARMGVLPARRRRGGDTRSPQCPGGPQPPSRPPAGTPVNRIPIMAKQVLDLFMLYVLVTEKGGLVEVINKKLWREITKGLNLPTSITSAAFTLRTQ
ncbi:AT-rich interactive domain-containing protein 3A [Plecturocebus cupreus]